MEDNNQHPLAAEVAKITAEIEAEKTPAEVVPVREGFDERGKFAPGNTLAKGGKNEGVHLRNKLHHAFLQAVGEDRLRQAIDRHFELIGEAKPREAAALLELLYQYCLGKPAATVSMEVTRSEAPAPLTLDAADIEALERIRSRMTKPE